MTKSVTNCCRVISYDNITSLPVRGVECIQSIQCGAYDHNFNTEEFNKIKENIFKDVVINSLSTFFVDVDYASFSNARRYLLDGFLPPKDAVRVGEFINYFQYDYQRPNSEHPLKIYT